MHHEDEASCVEETRFLLNSFTMRSILLATIITAAFADPDPGMVCTGCGMLASLGQEGAPVPWAKLTEGCDGDKDCLKVVSRLSKSAQVGTMENPDDVCADMGLCANGCKLYNTSYGPAWPPEAFPPAPPAWPVESVNPTEDTPQKAKNIIRVMEELGSYLAGQFGRPFGVCCFLMCVISAVKPLKGDIECDRTDVVCDITRFADYHYPLVDKDEDEFNDYGVGTLRGYHWRGRDCDTSNGQVYPGRMQSSYGTGKQLPATDEEQLLAGVLTSSNCL